MNHKALLGFALALMSLSACGDLGSESAELRGGRRRNNPCWTVRCAAGTHCESRGWTAACVADSEPASDAGTATSACAAILCGPNQTCVETAEGASCQCSSIAFCVEGYTWDSTRCECVRSEPTSSCATVLCAPNKTCVETAEGPTCQCSAIGLCIDGFTWDSTSCACVPTSVECTVDSDCRKESNYCGGCHCLALSTNESGPTCRDPVACFADPCSVTSGEAACVNGSCVLGDAVR